MRVLKTSLSIATVVLFFALFARAQAPRSQVVPPDKILKDLRSVLQYYSDHIRFDGDFAVVDVDGKPITKEDFFKQVTLGKYLPMQINSKANLWAYQLHKMPAGVDRDAQSMIKQIGATYYSIYRTVGKPFPDFHFVDLNGQTYTSANTKGKIVVLKAWFVSCLPCVKEMPELNKIVDQYSNRKDIVFLSIAFDSKEKLQAFTKRTLFKYKVIPKPMDYIQNDLHVVGYPAHWVIDKSGKVVNMSYNYTDMVAALNRLTLNKSASN